MYTRLSIEKLSDGKWHFVGPIFEKELHELSVKGFDSYQQAKEKMIEFGYQGFKKS